jgi:hypothetical protein
MRLGSRTHTYVCVVRSLYATANVLVSDVSPSAWTAVLRPPCSGDSVSLRRPDGVDAATAAPAANRSTTLRAIVSALEDDAGCHRHKK